MEDRLIQIVSFPSTNRFLNMGTNEAQQFLSRKGVDLGHALKHFIIYSLKFPAKYEISLKSGENALYTAAFSDKEGSLTGLKSGIEQYITKEDAPYVLFTYSLSLFPSEELMKEYSNNVQIYRA